jgi:hypothetical protein
MNFAPTHPGGRAPTAHPARADYATGRAYKVMLYS